MAQFNLATLVLRLTLGLFLAMHGYNKIFGGGRLTGTAAWFGSIGMKWPALQARLAGPAQLVEISSLYGHDAFLKESSALRPIFERALGFSRGTA